MIFSQSFVAILTLALAVAANPIVVRDSIVTIPFAKRVNLTGSANLVHIDQARAKALKQRAEAHRSGDFVEAAGSQPLTATPVSYVAAVRLLLLCSSRVSVNTSCTDWRRQPSDCL